MSLVNHRPSSISIEQRQPDALRFYGRGLHSTLFERSHRKGRSIVLSPPHRVGQIKKGKSGREVEYRSVSNVRILLRRETFSSPQRIVFRSQKFVIFL